MQTFGTFAGTALIACKAAYAIALFVACLPGTGPVAFLWKKMSENQNEATTIHTSTYIGINKML